MTESLYAWSLCKPTSGLGGPQASHHPSYLAKGEELSLPGLCFPFDVCQLRGKVQVSQGLHAQYQSQ